PSPARSALPTPSSGTTTLSPSWMPSPNFATRSSISHDGAACSLSAARWSLYAEAYCFFAWPHVGHGSTFGFGAFRPVRFAACLATRLSFLDAVVGCDSSEPVGSSFGSTPGSPLGIGGNWPRCVRYL